jgi:hypothetical protein
VNSIIFFNAPNEILIPILDQASNWHSLRQVSKESKSCIDEKLKICWNQLKLFAPFKSPYVLQLVQEAEQPSSHPFNYLRLFQKVAHAFTKYGVAFSEGEIPVTAKKIENLEKQVKGFDDELLAVSKKIMKRLDYSIGFTTAVEARKWLTNPDNDDILDIEMLDIDYLKISVVPNELACFTNLQLLNLDGNRLRSLPNSFGSLTHLKTLGLHDNQFTSVPEILTKLTQLTLFQLENNQLTSLPESLSNLVSLTQLNAARNKMTSVPESLGKLTNLTMLNLSGNKLPSLPDSLGNLTKLHSLNLESNAIKALPKSFGKCTQLANLALASNQLASLPESFANLHQLIHLTLNSNPFRAMPKKVVYSNNPHIRNNVVIYWFKPITK